MIVTKGPLQILQEPSRGKELRYCRTKQGEGTEILQDQAGGRN